MDPTGNFSPWIFLRHQLEHTLFLLVWRQAGADSHPGLSCVCEAKENSDVRLPHLVWGGNYDTAGE